MLSLCSKNLLLHLKFMVIITSCLWIVTDKMHRKATVFALQANLMLQTYQQERCILSHIVLQVLSLLDFSDGTLAEMIVNDGAIKTVKLIQGDSSVVDARNECLTLC